MNNTIYIYAHGQEVELKDRPCKVLIDDPGDYCEVVFVDTGQHEFVSRWALMIIECEWCKQPLIEIDFNRQYCIRLCNNGKCPLEAQQQGVRERSDEESKAYIQRRKDRSYTLTSAMGGDRRSKGATAEQARQRELRKARRDYQPWLARKKINYHKLKDLGYSSKEAMANSSDKRMRRLGLNV